MTKKIIFTSLLFVILISSRTIVIAEETTTSESVEPTKAIHQEVMPTETRKKEEPKKAEKVKITLEKKSFLENIKTKREETKTKFKTQREEFKQKVTTISDENKKEIVTRLDTKVSTLNTNFTTKMSGLVDKLSSVLSSVEEKITLAKSEGTDTTSAEAALLQANNEITVAKTAITAQAGKEYIIQITDESTLKNNVGTTVKQVQTDLQTIQKTVIEAKQAVLKVAQETSKLHKLPHNTATSQ